MPLIPGQGQPTIGIQVPVPSPVSPPRTRRQPARPTTPNPTNQSSSSSQQRTPTAVIFPWSLVRRR